MNLTQYKKKTMCNKESMSCQWFWESESILQERYEVFYKVTKAKTFCTVYHSDDVTVCPKETLPLRNQKLQIQFSFFKASASLLSCWMRHCWWTLLEVMMVSFSAVDTWGAEVTQVVLMLPHWEHAASPWRWTATPGGWAYNNSNLNEKAVRW